MPKATPLSRKYISSIEDAVSSLRLIGTKARNTVESLKKERASLQELESVLLYFEAEAYRIALELRQIEVAANCDVCPDAPPTTMEKATLIATADDLERLADHARKVALGEFYQDRHHP